MHGHEHIVAMRINGTFPPWVFINDYQCQTDWFEFGEHATVCTANDVIGLLDLRFLVGLQVSICATSECRAKELAANALKAGAILVAACHIQTENNLQDQSGWVEIIDIRGI